MDDVAILAAVRAARFSQGVCCPRCGQRECPRWGRFSGRQRYRCKHCQRTFSDLTGTPAAYSKRLGKWGLYSHCMHASATIRATAARVGIHPCTAFRWRHALLSTNDRSDCERLAGWTELAAAWFAHSEIGNRKLERPPRHRGLSDAWPDARLGVNVLIACDRPGHAVTVMTGRANARLINRRELERSLAGRFEHTPVLTSREPPHGPASQYAREQMLEYHNSRTSHLAGVETVLAYERRLLGWIRKFRGVATRYLPNYLAWHRLVDDEIRNSAAAILMRWPLPP